MSGMRIKKHFRPECFSAVWYYKLSQCCLKSAKQTKFSYLRKRDEHLA